MDVQYISPEILFLSFSSLKAAAPSEAEFSGQIFRQDDSRFVLAANYLQLGNYAKYLQGLKPSRSGVGFAARLKVVPFHKALRSWRVTGHSEAGEKGR